MLNLIESIEKRTSTRKFVDYTFSKIEQSQIIEILQQKIDTPFGSKPQFYFVDKQNVLKNQKVKLGTYGFITNGRFFIVGISNDDDNSIVDYGFALEKIILDLTAIGIESCWIGGTFSRSEFTKTIKLPKEKIIPAISVIGKKAKNKGVKERIIRTSIGANKRKKFEQLFFQNNFETPLDLKLISNSIKKSFEMLRLAPSSENFQPWRVLNINDEFHFFLKRNKIADKLFNKADLQMIDIGIAMCHFDYTLRKYLIKGRWSILEKQNVNKLQYVATWTKK